MVAVSPSREARVAAHAIGQQAALRGAGSRVYKPSSAIAMGHVMTETTRGAPALRLELDGPLAWIVADNAPRMNAFTAVMWEALPGLVATAEADERVRVLVLRGAGQRAFSAGADISEFESVRTGDKAKAYDALSDKAFRALIGAKKPTIAMIHGFCLGGGLGVAACCDLRIADAKAEFAIPAAKLGIGYNARWVRPLLAILPPPRVKELLFTGRRIPISEAEDMGLVNRVVAGDELEAATRALALEIAANAPLTIRAAKLAIDELWRHPENPDAALLDAAVEVCFDSDDYTEGRRAFLEKRKPEFRGR
jgi:enoyl-CoA hydratase/carnithine racemase